MVSDDVRVLKIEPGDLLMLETDQPISREQAKAIKARLLERPEFAGHEVVVLAGVRLRAVRV